jgi:hypothetical protein
MRLNQRRIRYDSTGLSNIIYCSKGEVRIKLDVTNLTFQVLNHVNYVHAEGKAGSLAMLKKKAKRAVEEVMDAQFQKEARPARQGKRIGGLPSKK